MSNANIIRLLCFTCSIALLAVALYTRQKYWYILAGTVFVIGLSGIIAHLLPGQRRLRTGNIMLNGKVGFFIEYQNSTRTIHWTDIENLFWLSEGDDIDLLLKDGSTLKIAESVTGYYALLRAVPKGINGTSRDYIQAELSQQKQDRQPCAICGYMALTENLDDHLNSLGLLCLNCGQKPWNAGMPQDEKTYLQAQQLEYFATLDDSEKVDFYKRSGVYVKVPGWQPCVTEAEVLAYSQTNYRD